MLGCKFCLNMAAYSGFPEWLLDSKDTITKGKEWNAFTEELYDAIQQQLTESHIQTFTDLTSAERALFVERAAKSVREGSVHAEMYNKIAVSLDQHLNNDVARQLMEEYPISTKTDLIIDSAQEGAVSLLKKWPDMKYKLHICFNQVLPDSLRQLVWRLFVGDTKVRRRYVDTLTSNPRSVTSPLDSSISRTCDQLLSAEPTFLDLHGSVGAFYGMKVVLSYYHALKQTRENLQDAEFLLIVPFLHAAAPSIPRRESLPSHVTALLVEEYVTFMSTRPGFVIDSGSQLHNEQMKGFVEKVAQNLQTISSETAEKIYNVFSSSAENTENTENTGDTSDTEEQPGIGDILPDVIKRLVRPIIRTMFVGYLRMPVVVFLWDQYMMTLDVPGFADDYLPAVMAIFLHLLKDKITECDTMSSLETVLKKDGRRLKIPQFQYELNKHYYQDLYALMNSDDKAALPALDPTQAGYPPWVHWFKDKIPAWTTPQDRRKAREEREAEKRRLLQQQREEDRRKKIENTRAKQETDDRVRHQAAKDRERAEEDRLYLEEHLEQERQKRQDAEKRAAEEINRLQREIDRLKRKKPMSPTPSAMTYDSVMSRFLIPAAPAPSVASRRSMSRPRDPPVILTSVPSPSPREFSPPPRSHRDPTPKHVPTTSTRRSYREPSPERPPTSPKPSARRTPPPRHRKPRTPPPKEKTPPPRDTAEDIIQAFVQRVADGFTHISHGKGRERDQLDEQTKTAILNHKHDVRQAEIELFGRPMHPGEFDKMSMNEKEDVSDQLMDVIKKRIEDRRSQELKKKRRK